jgi:hypothetical protein
MAERVWLVMTRLDSLMIELSATMIIPPLVPSAGRVTKLLS